MPRVRRGRGRCARLSNCAFGLKVIDVDRRRRNTRDDAHPKAFNRANRWGHAILSNFGGLILAVAATVNFVGFAWAVRGHFVSARMAPGMKAVSALSAVGFLAYLHSAANVAVPLWRIAIAMGLQALAGAMFLWACAATRRARPEMAFSPSEPTLLFNSGPYRFVRHPFYSSYILFWLACTLATTSLIVAAVTVALILTYTAAALREQSMFLKSAFGPQYEAYRKTTGLFWPKPFFTIRR